MGDEVREGQIDRQKERERGGGEGEGGGGRELAIGQMRCNLHLDYEIGFRMGPFVPVKIFTIVLLQRSPWSKLG